MHPDTPERTLDPAEQFFWMLDQVSSMNFVVIADLAGAVDTPKLQAALTTTQAKHALTNVAIESDQEGKLHFRPCHHLIPLRTQKATSKFQQIADELTYRFELNEAPLVRALLLESTNSSTVVLTFHHSIGDGRSAMQFLVETLSHYVGDAPLDAHPVLPPLHSTYPPQYQGEQGSNNTHEIKQLRKLELKQLGKPDHLPALQTHSHGQQPRLRQLVFEPSQCDALLTCCRQRGTTLHGLIGAAQLRAIAAAFPEPEAGRTLGLTSPADLRPHIHPKVSVQTPGLYVSLITTNERVEPHASIWELARSISEGIRKQVQRGDAHLLYQILAPLLALPATSEGIKAFAQAMLQSPQASLVSNIGRLAPFPDNPIIRVKQLSFALCPMPYQPLFTAVSTYEGTLILNINWDAHRLDDTVAHKLIHHIQQLLLQEVDASAAIA